MEYVFRGQHQNADEPEAPTSRSIDEFFGAKERTNPLFCRWQLGDQCKFFSVRQQQITALGCLAAIYDFRYVTYWRAAVRQDYVSRIHKVRVNVVRGHGMRFASDVLILKDHLAGRIRQTKA